MYHTYVCVCMYVHYTERQRFCFLWASINTFPCICTYVHTYMHTHMHTHTYIHIHIHTHIHACSRQPSTIARYLFLIHIHKFIHTYIHKHTQTHTRIYKYTHIHTYIPAQGNPPQSPDTFSLLCDWQIDAACVYMYE